MTDLKNTMINTLPEGMRAPDLAEYPAPGTPGGSQDFNEGVEKYKEINKYNINTLQAAQRTPEQMSAFQKAMSIGSHLAYKKRQASELTSLNFDPSKVSGGFFHDVISKLESERGEDTNKIYGGNMQVYRGIQEEVNKRLEYLQELENSKREFMLKYKYDKKAAGKLLTGKKDALKELKDEKEEFNRQYIQSLQRAGKDTSYMDFTADEIQQSIMAMANRNHSMDAIEQALNAEGVPTFEGSLAANYLNEIFK